MPGVCLKSAYLPHLIFIGAEMSSCCLNNAYLAYTDLADARLTAASLKSANLYAAGLQDAKLDGTDLTASNLYSTNLRANLNGAVGLTQEQLSNTSDGYTNARLPPDLEVPSHWRSTRSEYERSLEMNDVSGGSEGPRTLQTTGRISVSTGASDLEAENYEDTRRWSKMTTNDRLWLGVVFENLT
jgi:uncharacterized protein YjbI with pentapeptide repeats